MAASILDIIDLDKATPLAQVEPLLRQHMAEATQARDGSALDHAIEEFERLLDFILFGPF